MKFFLLLCMIFCHIVDDFYLQGILAELKQKDFWKKNAPDPLYKNDYKVALFVHGFSWAFMVYVPVFVYTFYFGYATSPIMYAHCISVVLNGILHSYIDNSKANEHVINLVLDQALHLFQIIIVWLMIIVFVAT